MKALAFPLEISIVHTMMYIKGTWERGKVFYANNRIYYDNTD
jgi:hypothetical protein